MLLSSQGRRNRRRPKYNHCDNAAIACVYSLALQYHVRVIEGREISLRHKGRSVRIGTVDEIKAMTLRSLTAIYEEITQEWRYEAMNPVGHNITPIIKSETRDAE